MFKYLITSLVAIGLFSFVAHAAVPSDYSLKEGDMISANGSADPDIYIVNSFGYKRLFLNPAIFGFYGQLTGGFSAVKNVAVTTRDAFPTTQLFQNCETNDQAVWAVEVTGEDTATLHHVVLTGDQAVAQDANFFKKVFCVNTLEANWYTKGPDYTALSQIPPYVRGAVSTPTPTPVATMTPSPTPSATPSPTATPAPTPTVTPVPLPVAVSLTTANCSQCANISIKYGTSFQINGTNFVNGSPKVDHYRIGQTNIINGFGITDTVISATLTINSSGNTFDVSLVDSSGNVISTLGNAITIIP